MGDERRRPSVVRYTRSNPLCPSTGHAAIFVSPRAAGRRILRFINRQARGLSIRIRLGFPEFLSGHRSRGTATREYPPFVCAGASACPPDLDDTGKLLGCSAKPATRGAMTSRWFCLSLFYVPARWIPGIKVAGFYWRIAALFSIQSELGFFGQINLPKDRKSVV